MTYHHLNEVRVLDLGIITAGASTSAILGDLGADVVKVEGPGYIDPFRIWSGREGRANWWNESQFFSFTNRNKRGICLDLKSPSGRETFLDLVRGSDVLLENFRVGVLERLGLDSEVLASANPRLIQVSISSQGTKGPDASAVSFGSTLEGSSGLASLIRGDDGIPTISGHALNYPDQVVSLFAAGAVLSALVARQSSGKGARVDISQRELAAFMLGELLVGGCTSEAQAGRTGAPAAWSTLIRSGDGRWVAVTLANAAALSAAIAQMGGVGTCGLAFEAAAACLSAEDVIAAVRGSGGSAEAALTAAELATAVSPSGLAFAQDPDGRPTKGLPWKHGDDAAPIRMSAPPLGRDNREVAMDLLGLDEERYEKLVADGVFADAPRG